MHVHHADGRYQSAKSTFLCVWMLSVQGRSKWQQKAIDELTPILLHDANSKLILLASLIILWPKMKYATRQTLLTTNTIHVQTRSELQLQLFPQIIFQSNQTLQN